MAEGAVKMEISLEKYEEMQDCIAKLEKENEELREAVSCPPHWMHWISVKSRLPEELTPVNVVWVSHNPQPYYSKIKDVPQSNATAVYFCGKWYWWDAIIIDWLGEYGQYSTEESLVDRKIEITHWMPLPAPPEVEKKHE